MYFLVKFCYLITVVIMVSLSCDHVVDAQYPPSYYPVFPRWSGLYYPPEGKRDPERQDEDKKVPTSYTTGPGPVSKPLTIIASKPHCDKRTELERDNIKLAQLKWIQENYPFQYKLR